MANDIRLEHPILDQTMNYLRMEEDLKRDHLGRWVIFHGSKLVGEDYDSYDDACEAARQMALDPLDCVIRQVGVEPPIILSYGR